MNDFGGFLKEANLIDGTWIAADDGSTIPVTNPVSGKAIGHIPNCGRAETNKAISAARNSPSARDSFTL